jgi:hypothetical protein
MAQKPFVQVEDKHGAIASIFIRSDNQHLVRYADNAGHQFYTETFNNISPELIEQSVIEWAKGMRSLS